MKARALFGCLAFAVIALAAPPHAQVAQGNSDARVANRIFQVWITDGFLGTVYDDCMKFTDTEVALAGCGLGQPVGTFTERGATWNAEILCPGVSITLRGLSIDGARTTNPKPVLAAVGVEGIGILVPESSTISLHGIEVTTCGPF